MELPAPERHMKISLKRYEVECLVYSEKFKKNWEAYCIAKDAWLAGYHAADKIKTPNNIVTMKVNDGDHQIGTKSTDGA